MQSRGVYLDYASSASIKLEALDEFVAVSKLEGNSSGISSYSKRLKEIENKSSAVIAKKLGVNQEQIHFVSSATFANNAVILGVAYKHPKCHLITSKIEHKSVLACFKHLEKQGYKVTYLDVDNRGQIDLNHLRKSVRNDSKLISIQTLNSEIGVMQNIEEIGRIAHDNKILFHTDASQSFCKYDIDVSNIDFMTVSGYKIGAPKGVAALYVKDASELQSVLFGSGDDVFPGTKSTALIASFAKAVEVSSWNLDVIYRNYQALVSEFSDFAGVYINSNPSHIFSISVEGVLLADLLNSLEGYGFSAGCSCLGDEKSNVIDAIDPEKKLPPCTIRISFSDKTSESDLIDFAKKIKTIVEKLRLEKTIDNGCQILSKTSDNVDIRDRRIMNLLQNWLRRKRLESPHVPKYTAAFSSFSSSSFAKYPIMQLSLKIGIDRARDLLKLSTKSVDNHSNKGQFY